VAKTKINNNQFAGFMAIPLVERRKCAYYHLPHGSEISGHKPKPLLSPSCRRPETFAFELEIE